MAGLSVELKGLAEVESRLISLGAVAGEKAIKSALRVGAKPILAKILADLTALPGSGALHTATHIVTKKTQGLGNSVSAGIGFGGSRFAVTIAPRTRNPKAIALANLFYHRKVKGVFWGHLVEWGARHRGTRSPGRLIFSRAVTSRAAEAVAAFNTAIRSKVDKALKKQSLE